MIVNHSQRYRTQKSQLTAVLTILFTLVLVSITILIVESRDLQYNQATINQIKALDIKALPCSIYCNDYTEEINGYCCILNSTNCQSKQRCYDVAVSSLESESQDDVYGIAYSAGPGVLFFLLLIFTAIHFYRLRKAAKEDLLLQQQQALLAQNQTIQEIQYQFDDESFQNYEEFIQFLIDSGYILPGMRITTKKRGDPKISDSFGTVDQEWCPICMVQLKQEKVLRLRCEHRFHSACIRDWNESNPSCPVCRADIYTD